MLTLKDAVMRCQEARKRAQNHRRAQRAAVRTGTDALNEIRCAILNSVPYMSDLADTIRSAAKEAERECRMAEDAKEAERSWYAQIGRIVAMMDPATIPDVAIPERIPVEAEALRPRRVIKQ